MLHFCARVCGVNNKEERGDGVCNGGCGDGGTDGEAP